MNGFNVEKELNDGVMVLSLSGYLDAHTAPQFEEEIEASIDDKNYKIVVNLQKLDYISSAGLGVFMGYIEDIRENEGDIIITNSSDKVFKVFDLLGFPNIFKILDTVELAIKELNS